MDLNGGLWTNLYLGRGPFLPVQNKYLTMDVTGKLLHSQASLPDGRRYATLQQGTSLHPLWWIQWPCWPGTENNWRYRFHIFLAYVCGNIPTKYGLIWYNTSNLGSWNGHWFNGEKRIYQPYGHLFCVFFRWFFWQNICRIDFGYGLEMVQYDQPPEKKMIGWKTWDG